MEARLAGEASVRLGWGLRLVVAERVQRDRHLSGGVGVALGDDGPGNYTGSVRCVPCTSNVKVI